MQVSSHELEEQPAVGRGYRLLRGLVRLWFRLVFRRIRLLHAEVLPSSGAAMLAVSHPASFRDALILVAAFERQIHCLLNRKLFRGALRGSLARGLGMIPYEPEGDTWSAAVEATCALLGKGEAVVVFAEPHLVAGGEPAPLTLAASTIALEAESRHSGQLGLAIFPLYLFLPLARPKTKELLLYVEAPIFPQEHLAAGRGDIPAQARMMAATLLASFRENAFRLQPRDIQAFLADLEEVLRLDLKEDWAGRPNWKQKVEGFTLSRFIGAWVEEMNSLNPGRLVALRDYLNSYREERRRWSLRQLEVEAAGKWLGSTLRRVWCWVESSAGLPVAAYGLLNHLLVWVFLFWGGLLAKASGQDQRRTWLLRALVVLGCYAAQVLLCAHWLGRATAGYYVLTLPLTGAYLWRYKWLLQHRTRFLFLSMGLSRQAGKLGRLRKAFLEEFNAARDVYVETLGIPR